MSRSHASPRPRPVSAARLEANRRNAQKSTGPRTPEGKAASRTNAVTHGLRCEVVEPEAHRPLIDARARAWSDAFGPDDIMQAWYVRRAAALSVRLDLCVEAEADARLDGAHRAAGRFETTERARIRQLAGQIEHDPIGVVEALEESAYGIDSLIAELHGMASDLDDSDGYLGAVERRRALAMLGINPKSPSINHEHPIAGPFMRAALANDPDHPPAEADRWTGLHVRSLPEVARRAEHARHLPSMEEGRRHCLAVIQARLEELTALRDAVYEEVDAPRVAEARRRGGAIGATKKAHTLRRYESALSLDMTRAMSTLSKLRRESDRRVGPAEPATAFDPLGNLASATGFLDATEPLPAPECPFVDPDAPAPNEPNAAEVDSPNPLSSNDFGEPAPPSPAAHEPPPEPRDDPATTAEPASPTCEPVEISPTAPADGPETPPSTPGVASPPTREGSIPASDTSVPPTGGPEVSSL